MNKPIIRKYRVVFYDLDFVCFFDLNFNLQHPFLPHCYNCVRACVCAHTHAHTHTHTILQSYPLSFSTDSCIFYFVTLHIPFSLHESPQLPIIYLVGSQVFLESKLKHHLHIVKPFLTTVHVSSTSLACIVPDIPYHSGL